MTQYEVRKVLYEGEGFRVVEVAEPINSAPFFQAYGTDGKEDFHCFANHTLADLIHNLRKNKPEWAREIDMAEYILIQSTKPLLEEVKRLKFARCKNCEWFSREPIEGKWPKFSSSTDIRGEKELLDKGFGRCAHDKMNEQAFFYDDEQVGFGQSDYPGKVDYTGMMVDCSHDECGFLFHETFGCVNFEKKEAEDEEH